VALDTDTHPFESNKALTCPREVVSWLPDRQLYLRMVRLELAPALWLQLFEARLLEVLLGQLLLEEELGPVPRWARSHLLILGHHLN